MFGWLDIFVWDGITLPTWMHTVYSKEYAHGFVVLCFVVVMQSFIMNSHEVFIHIHQGCFAGTGAIVRLPLCQWSKPDGYGKISQCITTTKHSKAKTMCIFLWIYCTYMCINTYNISVYQSFLNYSIIYVPSMEVPCKILFWKKIMQQCIAISQALHWTVDFDSCNDVFKS